MTHMKVYFDSIEADEMLHFEESYQGLRTV